MKVCVVGVGYVGLVTAGCLAETGNNVTCVDKDAEKVARLNDGQIPIYEPGLNDIVRRNTHLKRLHFTTDIEEGLDNSLIVFIAVGTPSGSDGTPDISAVLSVSEEIARHIKSYHIIATKSTVPVGTHKKVTDLIKSGTDVSFDYVSNPEFLKEGAAVEDFMRPERIIIGATSPKVHETMRQLYAPFMRKRNRLICMDPASAEMAKYAANTMLATRLSLMNEISSLCEQTGADIERVRQGIGSDSRIGPNFLFAGVGFGGSCFPKDLRALAWLGNQCEVETPVTNAVIEVNLRQQDRFAERVMDCFNGREEQTVLAVWGLAFKAQTDDIRESPAIRCIEAFLSRGFRVRAYDPEAAHTTTEVLGDRIEYMSNGYDALEGSDALVVLTDWQEFRNPDFAMMKEKLRHAVIFDGRNLYEPPIVAKEGFEYHSVGRATVFSSNLCDIIAMN